MNLFSIGFGIDFNSYLINWFKQLFPFPHQIFISSYFHKYPPNSSQTFQSFKISLISLQHSFKIRITPFSCHTSCCFTLQTWKGNGRTGNWSHLFISQEWISSSFHQDFYNLNLIVIRCLHERSPSILNMKSNLTIDDKRWDEDNSISVIWTKKDGCWYERWIERNQPHLKTPTFLISSSNLIQSSISHIGSSNINFSTMFNQNLRYLRLIPNIR